MNNIETDKISQIAKHVVILNDEVGKLKTEVKWIKNIIWYLAGLSTIVAGKLLFF